MSQQQNQDPRKLRKRLNKFLSSYAAVSDAVERHGDLEALLDQGGGLCILHDFLPEAVAEGVLALLEGLPQEEWNVTRAGDDHASNNISHAFLSTKAAVLEPVFRVFSLLAPDSLFTFSAARYDTGGHIKPHDDRAYTQVCMDDGSVQLCSRSIAVIFYLTKGWSAADGGALIDHEAPGGPRTYVPAFNSLVAFRIPRWHEVTAVTTRQRARHSIFGWFLEPGKLYDLQLQPPPAAQQQEQGGAQLEPPPAQQQEQQEQQQRAPGKKRKKQQKPDGARAPAGSKPGPPQQLLKKHLKKKKDKQRRSELQS